MSDTWTKLFGDRHWRLAEEYTGTAEMGTVKRQQVQVVFSQGKFRVQNGTFKSPLSPNLGTHGHLWQETDRFGNDIPGSLLALGVNAAKKAREMLGARFW